ncbi:MAG: hypothetical protein NVS9B4_09920 [Candidatus Acidiferrum sp.]
MHVHFQVYVGQATFLGDLMGSTKLSPFPAEEKVQVRLLTTKSEEGRALLEKFKRMTTEKAYQRFEEEGYAEGNELNHWFDAERQLFEPVPQVQESEGKYTLTLPINSTASSDKIFILVEDHGARIALEPTAAAASQTAAPWKNQSSKAGGAKAQAPARKSLPLAYYSAKWPSPVDPDSAHAFVKDGKLTVTVSKSSSARESDIAERR